jgi:hypothetical protein
MSLFNSQTIFSLFITLLIGFALYYYIKYKYRVLELTQREQAKVLQSVIMTMNNNNQNIMNIVQNRSQEEVVSDAVNEDINRFRQVNSNNELIDVSDDSDSDSESSDDSDESSGESSESSDSECDSDQGEEHEEQEEQEVCDNTTRKILFTGSNDSHIVEHLDGPDVKVIELTHPLYPKNGGEEYRDDDGDEDDEDEDEEEDSDSESVSSHFDGPREPSVQHEKDDIHEIKENVVINEINNSQTELETDNSLDNISVKAVFKTKESETHSDYNSMNVQSLRQLLKNKLSSEGSHMSEASINKLTKRDLIKHLS